MSKNRLYIISNCLSDEIELSIIKRGHLDFSVVHCADLDEVNLDAQKTIVVCKNDLIDNLVETLQQPNDELGLLFEQAVTLKRDGHEAVFIPSELDLNIFLNEVLPEKEVFAFSVFGKSLTAVQSDIAKLNVECKIKTTSQFIHTVFCSDKIVLNLLGDAVFSDKDESLESACENLLKSKNLAVSVAEHGVAVNFGFDVLKKCEIVANLDELDGEDAKQKAYNKAKALLSDADVAMCVLQLENQSFVAVGNKSEIHLFSTKHTGDILADFAVFRVIRFVAEKF